MDLSDDLKKLLQSRRASREEKEEAILFFLNENTNIFADHLDVYGTIAGNIDTESASVDEVDLEERNKGRMRISFEETNYHGCWDKLQKEDHCPSVLFDLTEDQIVLHFFDGLYSDVPEL